MKGGFCMKKTISFLDGSDSLAEVEKKLGLNDSQKKLVAGRLNGGIEMVFMTYGFKISRISVAILRKMLVEDELEGHIFIEYPKNHEKVKLSIDILESEDFKRVIDKNFKYHAIYLISREAIETYINNEYYLELR